MDITQLDRLLRADTIAPVYLVLGPEAYLRQSAIERIGAGLARVHATDTLQATRCDADGVSAARCVESAQSLGLFAGHQQLVVGDIAAWKVGEEALAGYLAAPNPATTLILWAEKLDQRTKWAKLLTSGTVLVECKSLYANQVPEWVRIECQRQGREISRDAARLLAEAVGSDLHAVHQAIEKVLLYTAGRRLVGPEDVEAIVLETSQRTIFELLGAVGRRDPSGACRLLAQLVAGGEPPVRICHMLAWHWRVLLRAREWLSNERRTTHDASPQSGLAAALKVSPYFARDYAAQAEGFADHELRNGFTLLAATDRRLKRSRVPGHTILTDTILRLCEKA